MNFFYRIFRPSPPSKPRRVLDVETQRLMVEHAIKGATQVNYHAVWTKEVAAVCEQADLEAASRKSWMPWSKHAWECENQAMALIDALQRAAATAGHTRAVGLLFADPPGMFQDQARHVYIIAIVGNSVAFFDPTAQQWCERPHNIYFTML